MAARDIKGVVRSERPTRSCCWVQYQQGRVILWLQNQRTLGSFTFQCKGVGFGVETMKYEKFWEFQNSMRAVTIN